MSLTKRYATRAWLWPSPTVIAVGPACRTDVSMLLVWSIIFYSTGCQESYQQSDKNLYYSRASPQQNCRGPGPGPSATRSPLPLWFGAWRAGGELGEACYFHKGLHNLSGPGPGNMIIKLGLAALTAPAPAAWRAPGAGASWPPVVELPGCWESKIPRQVRAPTPSPSRLQIRIRLNKTQPHWQRRMPHHGNQLILVSRLWNTVKHCEILWNTVKHVKYVKYLNYYKLCKICEILSKYW